MSVSEPALRSVRQSPKRHPFWGLRGKVIVTFLIPALLTVGLFVWFASFRIREGLDAELGKRLTSIAQSAVPLLPFEWLNPIYEDYHESRTYRNLRRKILRLQRATGVRRIYVFDARRKSLMDTRKTAVGTLYVSLSFDKLELEEVFRGKARASVLFLDQKGTHYKTGFAPLYAKGKVVAAVAVEGSAQYFKNMEDVVQELTLYGALSLLLVVLTGILFARWLAAPMHQLVRVAHDIGEGELTQPVPALGKDEIGFLAETMEEMRKNILHRDNQMQMMLSGIAHEVRNPLGGMELFSGILIEELEDAPEKRSHVERILRETRYLSNVVTCFLDYARPTSLDMQKHDWNEFSFELSMLLMHDLSQKTIELSIQTMPNLPELYFDRSRMQQALINILQNAIQASPTGSTVELKTALDEQSICIDICDQGTGISLEQQKSVFEPFYTTKEKGTGLGLPLAKKFIELHKGTLCIQSTEGEGTILSIRLPHTLPHV